jgi:hypothetical protein
VQRRRSWITATKETRKATTKHWRTTSKSNKKPGEKKNTKTKKKETVSVCISFFHQVLHQKQNCKAPHRKQNTRLGQKLPKFEEEKQTYTPYSLFFFPRRAGGEQEKTHQDKTPAEQNDGGSARSEDKQGSVAKRKIEETTLEQSQKRKGKKNPKFSLQEKNSRESLRIQNFLSEEEKHSERRARETRRRRRRKWA